MKRVAVHAVTASDRWCARLGGRCGQYEGHFVSGMQKFTNQLRTVTGQQDRPIGEQFH